MMYLTYSPHYRYNNIVAKCFPWFFIISFFCVCVCVVMYDDEFDTCIMENKILNMEKFKPRHVFF